LEGWKNKRDIMLQSDKQFRSCCNSCISIGILMCLKHLVSSVNRNTLLWATALGMPFTYIMNNIVVQDYYLGVYTPDSTESRLELQLLINTC